ncbi:hypothetical protein RhiirA1_392433 [Rhizophagus irregularis]|uniref:Uncharacterized protein n=1 Tax=Rhizophagus irregularis TaxID=588596 RepID=A0A2N0S0C6_9GLOM|nr:hypothetical protein RhiirA1_392433 [Rhizophagus irregularis]
MYLHKSLTPCNLYRDLVHVESKNKNKSTKEFEGSGTEEFERRSIEEFEGSSTKESKVDDGFENADLRQMTPAYIIGPILIGLRGRIISLISGLGLGISSLGIIGGLIWKK